MLGTQSTLLWVVCVTAAVCVVCAGCAQAEEDTSTMPLVPQCLAEMTVPPTTYYAPSPPLASTSITRVGDADGNGRDDVFSGGVNYIRAFMDAGAGGALLSPPITVFNLLGKVVDMECAIVSAPASSSGVGCDLIVLFGTTSPTISLFNSSASWTETVVDSPSTFASPVALAVGDVDGDGLNDLAVAATARIVVYPNNAASAGTFLPWVEVYEVPSGWAPEAHYRLGDLTGDGVLDLVGFLTQGGISSGNMTLFVGAGDGTFPTRTNLFPFAPVTKVGEMTLADVNKDGALDVVLFGRPKATSLLRTIVVGLGSGTDAPVTSTWTHTPVSTTNAIDSLVVTDVNGDGGLDLVFGSRSASMLAALSGDGSGAFSTDVSAIASNALASSAYWGVSVAEVDDDGRPDIVTLSDLFLSGAGTGDGTVDDSTSEAFVRPVSGGMTKIVTADLDGDLRTDVVSMTSSGVAVSLNAYGSGVFPSTDDVLFGVETMSDVAVADMDGDGAPDIVALFVDFGEIMVQWFANDGTGEFEAARRHEIATYPAGAYTTLSILVADMTGNAEPDVVVISSTGAFYLPNKGGGTFSSYPTLSSVPIAVFSPTRMGAAADLNGDGATDIVLSALTGVYVFTNDGVGSGFSVAVVSSFSLLYDTLALGDVNGDSHTDIVFGESSTDTVAWIAGSASGIVSGAVTTIGPTTSSIDIQVVVGDLNSDGALDVLLVDGLAGLAAPRLVLFTNENGEGSSWTTSGLSARPTVGTQLAHVRVHDVDHDGDDDVLFVDSTGSGGWMRQRSRNTFWRHASQELVVNGTAARSADGTSPCGIAPHSWGCVASVIAQTSLCGTDRVVLGAGSYSCSHGVHTQINHEVSVVGQGAEATVFNCSSGVLWRVGAHEQSSVPLMGALTLRRLRVDGTGGVDGVTNGAPGLRVENGGGVVLDNVAFSECSSSAELAPLTAGAGFGGAVGVFTGGALAASNTSWTGCSSSESGGAMYVTGTATLRECQIESCSSLGVGGGMSGDSAAVSLIDVVVAGNSASGNGGGVAIRGAGSSLTLERVEVTGNVADGGSGGGVYVDSSALPVSVSGTDAVFMGNSAGFSGGGLAATGVGRVSLSGAGVRMEGNVAGLGHQIAVGTSSGMLAAEGLSAVPRAGVLADMATPRLDVDVSGASGMVMDVSGAGTRGHVYQCGAVLSGVDSMSLMGGTELTVLQCPPRTEGQAGYSSWVSGGPRDWVRVFTSPTSVVVVNEPPAVVASGAVMGAGQVSALDAYGAVVVDSSLVLDVTTATAAAVIAGVDTGVVLEGAAAEFELGEVVVMVETQVLNASATLQVPVDVAISLRGAPADTTRVRVAMTVGVSACPAGQGRVTNVGFPAHLQCSECTVGQQSRTLSFEGCEAMPNCGVNSQRVTNVSTGIVDCLCNVGSWAPSGTANSECVACPEGGVCSGGTAGPSSAAGYYPHPSVAHTFVVCKRPGACIGFGACAIGYQGFMCNECMDEYFTSPDGLCVACPEGSGGIFAVGLVGVVVLAAVFAGTVGYSLSAGAGADANSTPEQLRRPLLPVAVSMALVAAQVMSMLGNAQYGWSSSARTMLSVMDVAILETSYVASECSVSSFHARYFMSLALPLGLLCASLVLVIVLAAAARAGAVPRVLQGVGSAKLRTLCDTTVFSLGSLLYIPVARASLILFDCTRLPNGAYVLDADPGVECFDGAWWGVAWIGAAVVAVFVCGVPGYMLWSIVRRKHKLMVPSTFVRFGSLYKAFRIPYFWGGVADLVRRLAIVVITLFVSEAVLVQLGLLCGVFVCGLIVVHARAPYFYPLYNALEGWLNVILLGVLGVGMGFHSERGASSSRTETFLAVVLGVLLGVFVVVVVKAVYDNVGLIIRSRKDTYSPAAHRGYLLAHHLQQELPDLGAHVVGDVEQVISHLLDVDGGVEVGMDEL